MRRIRPEKSSLFNIVSSRMRIHPRVGAVAKAANEHDACTLDMSRKDICGVQLSTVFRPNIVPLMETNLYANFCIYFFILRCSSMMVKFSITDAFALAAVLWLKSEVSMIGIKFIAYAQRRKSIYRGTSFKTGPSGQTGPSFSGAI